MRVQPLSKLFCGPSTFGPRYQRMKGAPIAIKTFIWRYTKEKEIAQRSEVYQTQLGNLSKDPQLEGTRDLSENDDGHECRRCIRYF
jgi:hypothetical protein